MPAQRSPRWTREEIAALKEFYPGEGVDCAERLPGRSWQAVHQKAHKLGLKCEKQTRAPSAKLEGDDLETAIRLREDEGWSFARIGARFGISEAAACNAVLVALCPRKGYRPAERDENGCLLPAGLERLRYALKLGLKGCDIQLRLGLSAGRVAEERRRYNRELKDAGKALLPPPGKGEAYSGVKLTRQMKREVEELFLQGLGTLKVSERTGVSKTSCTRIRSRLVARLRRKGEKLPGCDRNGTRHVQAESARFVTDEQKDLLRAALLQRVPVRRAALDLVIGLCTAYRLRDELKEELQQQGRDLPSPILPGRVKSRQTNPCWPPAGTKAIYAFRALLADMPFDEAKATWKAERRAELNLERSRPKSFEEQLERIGRGEIGIAPAFERRHLDTTVIREGASA